MTQITPCQNQDLGEMSERLTFREKFKEASRKPQ